MHSMVLADYLGFSNGVNDKKKSINWFQDDPTHRLQKCELVDKFFCDICIEVDTNSIRRNLLLLSLLCINNMNPGYFPLAATSLKSQ